MSTQWLNGTVADRIDHQNVRDRLSSALNNMEVQLDESSYNSGNNYDTYPPNDHGWTPTVKGSFYYNETDYLEVFAKKIAKAHRNGKIYAADGDAWIIVDSFELYGYGKAVRDVSVDLTGDGNQNSVLHVARALSMKYTIAPDPNFMTKNFVVHELAHLFDVPHKFGTYSLNSDDEIYDVTPMASAYVRTYSPSNDLNDTCEAGGDKFPPNFGTCNEMVSKPNKTTLSYCGSCTGTCRHDIGLTDCSLQRIDGKTPL